MEETLDKSIMQNGMVILLLRNGFLHMYYSCSTDSNFVELFDI